MTAARRLTAVLALLLALLAVPAPAETLPVEEFQVDGVPVLLRRNPDTPVVAAGIFLRGGSRHLAPEQAGLERLALTAAVQGGTRSLPKDEFTRRLDSMGSQIGASAFADFSEITVRCVRPRLEETWEVVGQVLAEPAFLPAEVDLARRQQIAALRREGDNPDSALQVLAETTFFAGHPYAVRPLGTLETVAALTPEQAAAHCRDLLTRSRMLVVFVGDVDRATVERLLRATTSRLPQGTAVAGPLPPTPPGGDPARVEARDLPTWYVRGTFPAPSPAEEDYAAVTMAAEILSDRLFEEARTHRNLVYSIYATVSGRAANYGVLYFTSTAPAQVMEVVRQEVGRLASQPVDPADLAAYKSVFLTHRWMAEASAANQVLRLGHAQVVAGNWRHADDFLKAVEALTPAQVQAAAQAWFKDAEFVLLGPQDGVDPAAFHL